MRPLFLICTLLISVNLFSKELDGIKFDDKIKLENKELILNGIGIRRATIFKVKVYYGGLYVDQKSSESSAILKSTSPKQIVMNFVHDVEAHKLASGFNDGLASANKDHSNFKAQMDKFNNNLTDVVKGDKIIITFANDGVLMNVKGKSFDKIPGADFSRALLSIWFINVADEGLRNGLLGQP